MVSRGQEGDGCQCPRRGRPPPPPPSGRREEAQFPRDSDANPPCRQTRTLQERITQQAPVLRPPFLFSTCLSPYRIIPSSRSHACFPPLPCPPSPSATVLASLCSACSRPVFQPLAVHVILFLRIMNFPGSFRITRISIITML